MSESTVYLRAIDSFQSNTLSKLSYQKGDIIEFITMLPREKIRGRLHGKVSVFDKSKFVLDSFTKTKVLYKVQALFKFSSDDIECLSIEEGEILDCTEDNIEGGWLLVFNKQNESGYIPRNRVKIIKENTTARYTSKEKLITVPRELPCNAKVLYPFKSCDSKTLSLEKDEEVMIVQCPQSNWWLVYKQKSFGYVPAAYLNYEKKYYEQKVCKYFKVNQEYTKQSMFQLTVKPGQILFVERFIKTWAICFRADGKKGILPFYVLDQLNQMVQIVNEVVTNTDRMGIVICPFELNKEMVERGTFITVEEERYDGTMLVELNKKKGLTKGSNILMIEEGQLYGICNESYSKGSVKLLKDDFVIIDTIDEDFVNCHSYEFEDKVSKKIFTIKIFAKPLREIVTFKTSNESQFSDLKKELLTKKKHTGGKISIKSLSPPLGGIN
ncbi:variant SH3 domain containing protein, putative [Entamoeba histolytica KU27]|uniref:Variant SH3 domain containing protein, putative n=1 Tax=Entamoeba histolytica KU27 TaxID=885311 RepID=M2RI07_ENTHI|nr:variant SH3 domain containing protein, putative [Entamoeba histolytica KU27]